MKLPRLHLPLAAPGVAGLHYLQILLAVGSVLLLLTSVWLWKTARDVDDHIAALETTILQTRNAYRTFRHQAEREGVDISPARLQTLGREVALANRVIQSQRFSWTQLLDDLERTTPHQLSMGSIVLNKDGTSLALSGTALTLQDLTAFVDQLKIHPAFQHVEISSHKSQRRSKKIHTGPATFIAFNLAVSYDPASEGTSGV